MSEAQSGGQRRTLIGRVVSDKMDKTVVVRVDRRFQHARYGKYVTRSKRYMAHDEAGACRVGDMVVIMESRPLSRHKRWTVKEVQKHGQAE